jgi:hypothetical protein
MVIVTLMMWCCFVEDAKFIAVGFEFMRIVDRHCKLALLQGSIFLMSLPGIAINPICYRMDC